MALLSTLGPFRGALDLLRLLTAIRIRRRFFFLSILLAAIVGVVRLVELRVFLVFLHGLIQHDFTSLLQHPLLLRIPGIASTADSFTVGFLLVVTAIFLLGLVGSALAYASSLTMQHQLKVATAKMRERLFARFLEFGKHYFDEHDFSSIQSVLVYEVEQIMEQLRSFHAMMSKLFLLLAYTVILSMISWQLTLLTLLIFFVFVLGFSLLTRHFTTLSFRALQSRYVLDRAIFSILTCIPLVQAYVRERQEREAFERVNAEEIACAQDIARRTELQQQVQEIGSLVGILLVAVAMAFVVPPQDIAHASSYILFLIVVRLMAPCFAALGEFSLTTACATHSLHTIERLLGTQSDVFVLSDGERTFSGLKESIEFRGLTFAYRRDTPVLHDVSFVIERGKTTAIVGATGSGKTTLAHLLLRFYDSPPGSILIDGTDIRDFSMHSLRSHIAFVSQELFFFNDTLRYNIAYGAESISEADIIDATKRTHLHDAVLRFPAGFDTVVGDRASKLSGGEKQRASLARALLRRADILILDEAASALDVRTERFVREAMKEVTQGKTLLLISHRLSTIQSADRIVVLEEGRMVEEGSYEELLAARGRFYEYWQEQSLSAPQT